MNNKELDINKILLLLKRNLWNIFFITILFSSAVALYVYFLKPVFSSSVTISVVNEQNIKLASVLPGQLTEFNDNDGELETIRLTLKSRKFINLILDDLTINQQYFIEKRFKKIEMDNFSELKMEITKLDYSLYESFFEVIPMTKNTYKLIINSINYEKIHSYGEEVNHEKFLITLVKKSNLKEKSYFFKNKSKRLLVDTILENMKVNTLSDSVIQIVYSDSLPTRAKTIVEKIAKKFIRYTLNKKTSELKKTLEFLDIQIFNIQNELKGEGEKLKDYQQKNQFFISNKGSSLYENITNKSDEVKILKLQFQVLKNFKNDFKKKNKLNTVSMINSGIDTSSIQSMIDQYRTEELSINEMKFQEQDISKQMTDNLQLNLLIKSLEKNKRILEQLHINFTYEHPQVLLFEKKVIEEKDHIQKYINGYIQKSLATQSRLKLNILNNIMVVQDNLRNKIEILISDLKDKNSLLKSLPEKDLVMQDLKRKFSLNENVYTFLLEKKMEVEMKKASTIANTQIIEDAIIPLFPIKPQKRMIVLVGILLGLILGIAYVFLKEVLDTKIRDASMIESLTDASLYGTLPSKNNNRFFKEAMRNIRTNLQFVLPKDKQCTTILISSTVSGEGKTTIVAGLAEIISQTDKKVLLMDLDLRKPRLYKEIDRSNKNGMSNFLTGDFLLEDVIQSVNKNLDFFPAGSVPPNPSELLMSSRFVETIEELMSRYDYILFDSAPIGSVTDANMLLEHTDLLLLVVRANYAEKIYLEKFNKMRKEKNIQSAGIILNHVQLVKDSAYGYGYGYGYGYDYGYGSDNKKEL